MICGVVLVKSVKIVFTLKQFGFSFLDETAVTLRLLKRCISVMHLSMNDPVFFSIQTNQERSQSQKLDCGASAAA